jgi:hypothetical protein
MSKLDTARGAKPSTSTRRRRPVLSLLVGSAMALVIPIASAPAALSAGRAQSVSTALTCDGAWHIVASPNPGPHEDELLGVAAVSPSLAWTVGVMFAANDVNRSLIEKWDGTAWTQVPSANPGHIDDALAAAAAPDATHAFAVGERRTSGNLLRPLIEQFDGTSWSVAPSPHRGTASALSGVAAIDSTDAWAVGERELASGAQAPLVEHWNGATWSVVRSPYVHQSPQTTLSDVSAVSSTDVWAVGTYFAASKGRYQPLAEHWDGTSWSIVPTPDPGGDFSFSSLTALAADDVWAVGYSGIGNGPFAEHWDGSSWNVVTTTNPGRNSLFLGVAAAGSQVYATGVADPGPFNTLAERWDGTSFQVMSTPNVGGKRFDNFLHRAASDGTVVWSVGDRGGHSGIHTLVEYVC